MALKFELTDDDIRKELDLEKQLFEGLPKPEKEITQEDIELLATMGENESLMNYLESLTKEQRKTLISRAKQLHRPGK